MMEIYLHINPQKTKFQFSYFYSAKTLMINYLQLVFIWRRQQYRKNANEKSSTCQSWAFATFFPFPYSLIHYFNVAIRYRYSATFQKFAIRYSLYAVNYSLLPLNSVIGFI
jgi:hypothetical protein